MYARDPKLCRNAAAQKTALAKVRYRRLRTPEMVSARALCMRRSPRKLPLGLAATEALNSICDPYWCLRRPSRSGRRRCRGVCARGWKGIPAGEGVAIARGVV